MSSWDQEAKDSDLSGCEALSQPARIAGIRGTSEELWPEIPVVTGDFYAYFYVMIIP